MSRVDLADVLQYRRNYRWLIHYTAVLGFWLGGYATGAGHVFGRAEACDRVTTVAGWACLAVAWLGTAAATGCCLYVLLVLGLQAYGRMQRVPREQPLTTLELQQRMQRLDPTGCRIVRIYTPAGEVPIQDVLDRGPGVSCLWLVPAASLTLETLEPQGE